MTDHLTIGKGRNSKILGSKQDGHERYTPGPRVLLHRIHDANHASKSAQPQDHREGSGSTCLVRSICGEDPFQPLCKLPHFDSTLNRTCVWSFAITVPFRVQNEKKEKKSGKVRKKAPKAGEFVLNGNTCREP
jgi:hypothetical protein